MAETFKISSFIPRLIEPGAKKPYERMYRATEMLDRLGFYTGYIGHHSFTKETPDASAPMVVMGALAARTENIRLGTGIYLAALHHPVNVIEQVSQVDQVSGGRVTLGVGVGYRDYEYEGYNVDFNSRGRRLTDMVGYMKHAWSTGRHGWNSEFFDIRDNLVDPPCVQRPNPPILGGGTSKSGIKRAATVCDGWFSLPMETLPVVKQLADSYREQCAAAGVKPYICLMRETWAAPTQEIVEEQWFAPAREFHKYYWHAGTRGDAEDPVLQRVANDEQVDFREFVHNRAIAGTPDLCIEEIRRWHEAVKFDELALYFNGPRVEGVWEPAVEFFAKEVMPAFR
ncbi:MAG: hypothetical protein RJB08_1057 [Actinomycetota bacterium]